MFKRLLCIGFLMLPGSFLVIGVACIDARLRRKIMQFAGLTHSFGWVRSQWAVARVTSIGDDHEGE